MKKTLKALGALLLIGAVALAVVYFTSNESLPKGKQGPKADDLATKMLKSLNYKAYKNTRFIEWSFRGKHFYKWDKQEDIVEVSWNVNKVTLHTKNPEKSVVLVDGKKVENKEILQNAIDYFNNDSFWLVAPYKVFESGIERRIVMYEGKEALLITYTTGGSTPGDSYLWILEDTGMPISYKMWVSIIPTGGMEATWSDWIRTESGAVLPTKHEMSVGTLDMGNVKAYN
ncbi:conserved hypothetical protein [Tenacibaculum sediminilitoris]|uniref:hypothetical protein n=1 Tax=Tenacibaculum sediminilitoris TaxID=1820334 RepID=UPI00389381D9